MHLFHIKRSHQEEAERDGGGRLRCQAVFSALIFTVYKRWKQLLCLKMQKKQHFFPNVQQDGKLIHDLS